MVINILKKFNFRLLGINDLLTSLLLMNGNIMYSAPNLFFSKSMIYHDIQIYNNIQQHYWTLSAPIVQTVLEL